MRCDSGKPAYLRLRRMCLTAAPSSSAPTHARSRTHTHTRRGGLSPIPIRCRRIWTVDSPFLRCPPHLPAGGQRLRPARANPSREKLSQKSFSSISSDHETMGQAQNSKGPNLTLDRPWRASQSCKLGSICAPLAREGEIRRGRAHPRGGGRAKEQAFLHARELVRRQTRAGLPGSWRRRIARRPGSMARLSLSSVVPLHVRHRATRLRKASCRATDCVGGLDGRASPPRSRSACP